MKVAVFGGSFNPPTKSHESIIAACLADERFDQVWVMPSGTRDDKPELADDNVRLHMLELIKRTCFSDNPRLVISDFELHLPRPSRTSRTLGALAVSYPEDSFYFVFGADSYWDMPNWEGGQRLQRELQLLIAARQGFDLPAPDQRIYHLKCDSEASQGISSTAVREARAANRPIASYVCPAVEQFINDEGLYKPFHPCYN